MATAPIGDRKSSAGAVLERCHTLAALSEMPGGLLRTFLSPAMREAHFIVQEWMEAAGMQVRTDAAGNLRGIYPAAGENARRLLLGSHIDTVPDAGAFDGVLGVMLAIAMVENLGGRRLPYAIEVTAFSDEEGVRFGVPFLGSRALVGAFGNDLLERRDGTGVSVADAITAFGLDPAQLPEARITNDVFGYLEFHIEQGPVLDSLGLPLGVVTSISGQSRYTVRFRGQANHAGATPMHLRRDALATASRWISLVERYARATPRLVATVGAIEVRPGAANIVPGEVRASLDVRHPDDSVRKRATAVLLEDAQRIAKRCGITAEWQSHSEAASTICDPSLVAAIGRAVTAAGHPVHRMSSGAGHDAMILAKCVPTAMLFLRTPGGISHHPEETVQLEDVEAALAAGAALLMDLEQRRG